MGNDSMTEGRMSAVPTPHRVDSGAHPEGQSESLPELAVPLLGLLLVPGWIANRVFRFATYKTLLPTTGEV